MGAHTEELADCSVKDGKSVMRTECHFIMELAALKASDHYKHTLECLQKTLNDLSEKLAVMTAQFIPPCEFYELKAKVDRHESTLKWLAYVGTALLLAAILSFGGAIWALVKMHAG